MPPRINATISIKKNCNIIFQKWGGGCQRPFGIFPKNHPIWWRDPSLRWLTWSVLHSSLDDLVNSQNAIYKDRSIIHKILFVCSIQIISTPSRQFGSHSWSTQKIGSIKDHKIRGQRTTNLIILSSLLRRCFFSFSSKVFLLFQLYCST